MVFGGVYGDLVELGVKSIVVMEVGQCVLGFDKCFLGDVLDFVVVMYIVVDQCEDMLLVFEYQYFEGMLIVGFGFFD